MARLSAVLRSVQGGFAHWCPACDEAHAFAVSAPRPNGALWSFDGNVAAPTFAPSMHIKWGKFADPSHVHDDAGESGVCHYFLRAGMILFLADCTHEMAGRTVALPDFPYPYGSHSGED